MLFELITVKGVPKQNNVFDTYVQGFKSIGTN